MIRAATPFDAPEIYRLSVELHSLSRYRDIPICEEKVKKLIAFLIGSPSQFCWVSERDGKLCGMLLAAVDEILFSRKKEAHDLWFYVNLSARGDGARLAKRFIKWAKERNIVLFGLSMSSGIGEMDRIAKFYRSMGLEKHGEIYAAFNKTNIPKQ